MVARVGCCLIKNRLDVMHLGGELRRRQLGRARGVVVVVRCRMVMVVVMRGSPVSRRVRIPSRKLSRRRCHVRCDFFVGFMMVMVMANELALLRIKRGDYSLVRMHMMVVVVAWVSVLVAL